LIFSTHIPSKMDIYVKTTNNRAKHPKNNNKEDFVFLFNFETNVHSLVFEKLIQ